MLAIMGRMCGYTGQALTWDECFNSKQRFGPAEYAWNDNVPAVKVAIPGKTNSLVPDVIHVCQRLHWQRCAASDDLPARSRCRVTATFSSLVATCLSIFHRAQRRTIFRPIG